MKVYIVTRRGVIACKTPRYRPGTVFKRRSPAGFVCDSVKGVKVE